MLRAGDGCSSRWLGGWRARDTGRCEAWCEGLGGLAWVVVPRGAVGWRRPFHAVPLASRFS